MSVESQESPDTEERYTKKVDLVCYLNTEGGETRRQFAQRVDEDIDFFEKETEVVEDSRYYIRARGVELSIDEEEYNVLQEVDLGDAHIVEEVNRESNTEYAYDPSKALRDMFYEVLDEVYELEGVMPEGWEEYLFNNRLVDEDGNIRVRYYMDFTRMPMLKHQSEISPDDMYEDEDEDYLACKIKVKFLNVTKENLEYLDDNLLHEIMTRLGRHDWIDRVRTYDCEVQTTEKGVCFNI